MRFYCEHKARESERTWAWRVVVTHASCMASRDITNKISYRENKMMKASLALLDIAFQKWGLVYSKEVSNHDAAFFVSWCKVITLPFMPK